jgi:basic amino acid/polyamine antiporter, APA family
MAELKKNIGFLTIFALLITSLLGTGIFLTTGVIISFTGTAGIISWVIMFLISLYIASCFGELVALYPNAGGVYEFSKKAYGRFPSFIIGWTTWLVNTINTPLLIVAALKIAFPTLSNLYFVLICIGIIIFMNYITYRGMKDSSILLYIFAVITLGVIVAFIVGALPVFNPQIIFPIKNINIFLIFIGAFFISETFFGWESASFLAEETNNARKVIPKALIISTIIVGLLSVLVGVISLGILPIEQLINNPNSFNILINAIFAGSYLKYFIIGILIIFIGSAFCNIISTPRLLLAMARDKLFIEQFSEISSKKNTPYKAILFQTIVGIILVFISLGQYKVLLSILIPLSLLMYLAIIISVPVLRKKDQTKRSFKAPLGNFLPYVVGLLILAFIIAWLILEPNSFYLFRYALGFIIFALPIYLMLNIYYNPSFTIKINEYFAHLSYYFENVFFPKSIRRKIISIFTDYKNKKILEFGSGIGSLTTFLADQIGEGGKIYAVDFSQKNIKILNKRLIKENKYQVEIIHDEHIINRIHPNVPKVDMIFSVGMIGYVQDIQKILREMNDILPESGKICFIEYVDYFKVIPNPKIISNKAELIELFKKAGFAIRIEKIKGFLWNYYLIYGIKTSHKNIPYA